MLCYDITVSYTNIDAGSYRNAIDISDGNYALWGRSVIRLEHSQTAGYHNLDSDELGNGMTITPPNITAK